MEIWKQLLDPSMSAIPTSTFTASNSGGVKSWEGTYNPKHVKCYIMLPQVV